VLDSAPDADAHSPEAPMTRTILAVAPAAVLALWSVGAEACISCEYVPEVVRNHTTDTPRSKPQRAYTETRERKQRKKVTEREPAPRKKVVTEREEAPAKKKEVVNREPAAAKTDAANEASSITAAGGSSEKAVTSTAAIAPGKSGVETEHSAISTGTSSASGTDVAASGPPTAEAAERSVGCKKFFPTVGMTLSVPCE
jgi:outer membrane biosynthesis protein TonB